MNELGHRLEFISWIKRDGSGVVMIPSPRNESEPKLDDMSYVNNERFELNPLSLSQGTFIASGFNSFVVRLKNP